MTDRGLLEWPTWIGVLVENPGTERRLWGDLLGLPEHYSTEDSVTSFASTSARHVEQTAHSFVGSNIFRGADHGLEVRSLEPCDYRSVAAEATDAEHATQSSNGSPDVAFHRKRDLASSAIRGRRHPRNETGARTLTRWGRRLDTTTSRTGTTRRSRGTDEALGRVLRTWNGSSGREPGGVWMSAAEPASISEPSSPPDAGSLASTSRPNNSDWPSDERRRWCMPMLSSCRFGTERSTRSPRHACTPTSTISVGCSTRSSRSFDRAADSSTSASIPASLAPSSR